MDTIAQKIKRKRFDRQWTQEDLAKEAKLTPRTIVNIESGKSVNLGTITAIANAFECPVAELFSGD